MESRISVAVLGATGSVGQRFVQLLDGHPWFEVVALTGSDRKISQQYGNGCHWVLSEDMPGWARGMRLKQTTPDEVEAKIVFSALPSHLAKTIEPQFAERGVLVCSNASAYRQAQDVPILLPEVNPDHAKLLDIQRRKKGWQGGIVTNPNCTSTGMTVALKALDREYGLKTVFAVSMQALSGAGYPGVASLDIMDNVIPFIDGEEEKVETETRKMLGRVQDDKIEPLQISISAHTNRVPVSDGHLVCLSVKCDHPVDPNAAKHVLSQYTPPEISRDLPSTPDPVILVRDEMDRPQPRLDRMAGKGMSTTVGRLRPDPIFDLKLVVLSHNTIRGAAGGSIYNAELLVKMGLVS